MGPSLRQVAEPTGRLFGAAVAGYRLVSAEYGAAYSAAAKEFAALTPENEMKWESIEPERGAFNFVPADRVVSFAEDNDMVIRGHTLVWHSQLPEWVKAIGDRDELVAVMERHIDQVMGQYRGRVAAWDVVNEAFTDWRAQSANQATRPPEADPHLRGTFPSDIDPAYAEVNAGTNGLDSVFGRVIGPEYVELAFRRARAADPNALLFYNDFGAEGLGPKSDAVYEFVRDLKERGVPIDGVGLQMHISALTNTGDRSVAGIRSNMQRLADLGLQVQITEFDVALCGDGASAAVRRVEQEARWREITRVCLEQPACSAVVVWGVADPNSWRDRECSPGAERSEPLLFDLNYRRKSAHSAVAGVLVEGSVPLSVDASVTLGSGDALLADGGAPPDGDAIQSSQLGDAGPPDAGRGRRR